jgi:hypothetical protein
MVYQLYECIYAILQKEKYRLWRLCDIRNSKVLNVSTLPYNFITAVVNAVPSQNKQVRSDAHSIVS